MRRVLEGSVAVAEAVRACRPHVISAYPITPQTHIVEALAKMVADGELEAEFVKVDSEFSAASVALGASAAGARAYSATTSQGLLLMLEVLFNIAGLRLPMVMTVANRAVSSPLNIWNDQQDSMTVRDSGWIQFFAQDSQECVDLHIQAFRVAEDHRVHLPVIVNMDGFILTHTYEPVEIPDTSQVDRFLPPYSPLFRLDPDMPLTLGAYATPDWYHEIRHSLHEAMVTAKPVICEVAQEYAALTGRFSGELIDGYNLQDAEVVFVAMGSVLGTVQEVVDSLRREGVAAGALKVRCLRPFPDEEILQALRGKRLAVVLEKAVCLGGVGILAADIRSALYGREDTPSVAGAVIGLGGRDISAADIRSALEMGQAGARDFFVGLRKVPRSEQPGWR